MHRHNGKHWLLAALAVGGVAACGGSTTNDPGTPDDELTSGSEFAVVVPLLDGGTQNQVTAMSSNSHVVAGWSETTDGKHAFRWHRSDADAEDLGTLPGATAASAVTGMSSNGDVIVGYSQDSTGLYQGFVWTKKDGMKALTPPTAGQVYPTAVSGDGKTIVGCWASPTIEVEPCVAQMWPPPTGGGASSGFIYTEADGFRILSPPQDQYGYSAIWSTNENGSVFVGDFVFDRFGGPGPGTGTPVVSGSRWTAETEPGGGTMIGFLDELASTARIISADGLVVGGTSLTPSLDNTPVMTPVRWTPETGLVDMLQLTSYNMEMNAISEDGSVMAGGGVPGQQSGVTTLAWAWDDANGFMSFNDLFTVELQTDLGTRLPTIIRAVSADGKIFSGVAVGLDRKERGFVAKVPLPEP